MERTIFKFLIFAVIALQFMACKQDTIYVEPQNKPVREPYNRFVGTWVRCGETHYTNPICLPDSSTVVIFDTLIITKDTIFNLQPANEIYRATIYEFNENFFFSYIIETDNNEYYPNVYRGIGFKYNFLSDSLLNISRGRGLINGIRQSHNKRLCYRKIK